MKYILERIQVSRSEIVNQLLVEIQVIQQNEPSSNVEPMKAEIENLGRKKKKAIDLMLDELISKEDLKKQTEFYDSEIARLTEEIAASQDVSSAHQKQIDGIRNYIRQVNQTAEMDTDNTKIYGELLKKVVVQENQVADFYLTCVPFGFRIAYHVKKFNQQHRFDIFVDNCEVIY